MISFERLFLILKGNGIKRADFMKAVGIHANTITALSHDNPVSTETIDKICTYLNCQPSDIMEWFPNKDVNISNNSIEEAKEKIKRTKTLLSSLIFELERLEKDL